MNIQIQYDKGTGEIYMICRTPSRFDAIVATETHDVVEVDMNVSDLPDDSYSPWKYDSRAKTVTTLRVV